MSNCEGESEVAGGQSPLAETVSTPILGFVVGIFVIFFVLVNVATLGYINIVCRY